MEARATFRGARIPVGVILLLMVALYLLGGASGYLVRALSFAESTTTATYGSPHPFVTDRASYSFEDQQILTILKQSNYEGGATVVQGGSVSPVSSPAAEPARDPKGRAVT